MEKRRTTGLVTDAGVKVDALEPALIFPPVPDAGWIFVKAAAGWSFPVDIFGSGAIQLHFETVA